MGIVQPTVQDWCTPAQYTSSPAIIKNCLQEVLENSTLNLQANELDNEDMTRKKREQIITAHTEHFTIKYYESDKRWHTMLPDEHAPHGKRALAKRYREDLEETIVRYYDEQENGRKKLTLRKLYPEWFQYKWQDTNNSNYMKRIDNDWRKYYENDRIVDRPISEFTAIELKRWARGVIIRHKLTKKQYHNMAVIIRQCLDYLVELGELPTNHYNDFHVNPTLFTPIPEKEPEQEVFNEAEEQLIKDMALKEFAANPKRTLPLAVALNFSLALRVGELVALKWKDLRDGYLSIRRMEQRQYEQQADGKWKCGHEIVEHTKSEAGCRKIYVVSSAMELFDKIRESNLQNGYSCEPEDFIFQHDRKRISANSIDWYYEKYCRDLKIIKKGNHKARKTALTKIADNPNINLKDTMQFGGHKDVATFISHYCYSRYSDNKRNAELEKTLNFGGFPGV